jgi:predicted  nucleic acid-binding Zn-ribbon protein
MEIRMKKILQKWLGIVDSNDFIERIRHLESLCDDLKYEQENLEYNLGELEIRVDELESIDFDDLKYDLKSEAESLKEEVNEVLSNFESMTEGYTVSVKLNPPL